MWGLRGLRNVLRHRPLPLGRARRLIGGHLSLMCGVEVGVCGFVFFEIVGVWGLLFFEIARSPWRVHFASNAKT